MITRSGKLVPYIPAQPRGDSPTKRRALQPEETQVNITVSATGKGTHTRWVRQPQPRHSTPVPSSSSKMNDPFVTPPVWIPTEPPQPERISRTLNVRGSPLQKRERVGQLGIFNLAKTKAVIEIESEGSEKDVFVVDAHERLQKTLAEALAANRATRRGPGKTRVGATGTLIIDDDPENDCLASPFHSQPHPPASQPLGPNGTYLVGMNED